MLRAHKGADAVGMGLRQHPHLGRHAAHERHAHIAHNGFGGVVAIIDEIVDLMGGNRATSRGRVDGGGKLPIACAAAVGYVARERRHAVNKFGGHQVRAELGTA